MYTLLSASHVAEWHQQYPLSLSLADIWRAYTCGEPLRDEQFADEHLAFNDLS